VIVAVGASVWAAKRKQAPFRSSWRSAETPVGTAMVSNLARPGRNITGLSFMSSDLAAKRLELLKQTFPRIACVAVFYLPAELSTGPELWETESRCPHDQCNAATSGGPPTGRSRAALREGHTRAS
jgi:putative ABC transport system substrate-binding protein